jgi:tetratricopeptide (TPR) repeat protein
LIAKERSPIEEFITLKGTALYVLNRHEEVIFLLNNFAIRQKTLNGSTKAVNKTSNAPLFYTGAASAKAEEEFHSWNRALLFLSSVMQDKPGLVTREDLRTFLLDAPVNAAYRWAYDELLGCEEYILPDAEKIAAAGRIAVLTRNYKDALLYFDKAQSCQLSLFFLHTALLSDLGRAYTDSSREKGFKLFTDWENSVRTGKNSPVSPELGAKELKNIRYTLLFYAGRIRRQQGKHGEAQELFTRAVSLAPDADQKDTCIWYLLSSALTEKPETVSALIRSYSGIWDDDNNFYDILDKLSCYLAGQKKWGDIADVFASIRN